MAPLHSHTCRWKWRSLTQLLFVLTCVTCICIGIVSIVSQNDSIIRKWTHTLKGNGKTAWSHQMEHKGKPHFVLGILSTYNRTLRDTQRQTWISTMLSMENELPFRITYKFLIDLPTDKTIEENDVHQDIIYLNVTHHGYAVKFAEKIYVWFQYVRLYYPDVSLTARLDDDVFICVTQLFNRLEKLLSPTLYYGWMRDLLSETLYYEWMRDLGKKGRADDMFVVVGRVLLDRIVNRKLCEEDPCDYTDKLIVTDFGDKALAQWVSIYNDTDYQPDNERITHIGRHGFFGDHAYLITEKFCRDYLIFHKSSVKVMQRLHQLTKSSRCSDVYSSAGAVTGNIFSGEVSRHLPRQGIQPQFNWLAAKSNAMSCDQWAVVTTINSPTKAVMEMVKSVGWCVLIVADSNTPPKDTYLKNIASKNVKYLTVEEQNNRYPFLSRTIPFKHFGRKNIGYMYAVQHKAKLIWDFDDDNIGFINDTLFGYTFRYVKPCNGFSSNVLNPYPYFGTNETRTWPRGFPLQLIKNETTVPNICNSDEQVNVGVIQSLANKQPDVDAIYRLTRGVPFNFKATRDTHRPLVLPKDVYAPFNAQATMWFPAAFPFIPLPIRVNGRVSDIWRSYIAQHFMFKRDIRLAFSSPYVVQERNAHSIINDFNAELDLFSKSKQMVDFMLSCNHTDILDMYKDLYTRHYLDESDLWFIEAWQNTFHSVSDQI